MDTTQVTKSIMDFMKIKSFLTDFIINYPTDTSSPSSKLGNTLIFPCMNYILSVINESLSRYSNPNDKVLQTLVQSVKLAMKGGLVTNMYLKKFMDENRFDSLDKKTVQNLTSKDSDYDSTFILKPALSDSDEKLFDNPVNWNNFIESVFSIIEREIATNKILRTTVGNLSQELQKIICKGGVRVNVNGKFYNAIPLKTVKELYDIFPGRPFVSTFQSRNKSTITISYTNRENLFLVFKSDDKTMWARSLTEVIDTLPSDNALSFSHTSYLKKPTPPNFLLARIMGCMQIYEIYPQNTLPPSSVITEVENKTSISSNITYKFELLDISVDTPYTTTKYVSKLGVQEIKIDNFVGKILNGGRASDFIEVYTLNLGALVYDNYKIFLQDTFEKVEKRCYRLIIFLRVYNLIKLDIFNKIIQSGYYNYLFAPNISLTEKYTVLYNELSIKKDFRDQIATQFPEYMEIKEVETVIKEKGLFDKFIANIRDNCLNTKNPEILRLRDQLIYSFTGPQVVFTKFIGKLVDYFDIVKDGTLERMGKSGKDVDYFMRLTLRDNIPTWEEVSQKMQQIYGGTIHRHGGVKFIEDVKRYIPESNIYTNVPPNMLDILDRIIALVNNNIVMSYDIDTFTIESDIKRMDFKINQVLETKYKVVLKQPESYNWEIVKNLQESGIYKSVSYNPPVKPCAVTTDAGCYMLLYKDDLYTVNRNYLPYTVVRGNVLMRQKYCDLYYVATTIDFNVVDRSNSIYQISIQNPYYSFQLCIMLLLDSSSITTDIYGYLTNLYLRTTEQSKRQNKLIRAVFYGAKMMSQYGLLYSDLYPFSKLDEKINDIFTSPSKIVGLPDLSFMTNKLQNIRLTATEISSILDITHGELLDEVVDTRKLSQMSPACLPKNSRKL